jgi:ubiquitin-like-conjugating enzyme ATG10
MTPYSLAPPDSPFPLLSQGDHPSLGTPSWYLHPCGLPSAMDELSREAAAAGLDKLSDVERKVRELELWFLVVASVVDLRE